MFSPHHDDHGKGPDLTVDLDHHTHQSLVTSSGVPQPLMLQQPLSLDIPQPDPFDDDGGVHIIQHQHQHQHPNPTEIQNIHANPSDIQPPHPPDMHLDERDDSLGQHQSKKQRRRYDNNFKAEVLEHLKMPGAKLPQIAKNFGIPENTLREWTKVSVVQSIEEARTKHGGGLKANMFDPMHRLTESLMVFFDRNDRQPPHLKQPVTTKLVVAKGLEARNNLLELNEIQPFLDPKEKKALESFTGSDSWAKKFAKRHDLKMTGARVKELGDDDVRNFRSVYIICV